MYIQTENTPNPNSLKFLPGQTVSSKNYNFPSIEDAKNSPLARSLFSISGVKEIYIGDDFITITRDENTDWMILKPQIITIILEHFVMGFDVMEDGEEQEDEELIFKEEDREIAMQIKELIDIRVRPSVAQDGGDIIFKGFEDGIVKLKLMGACSGCPSSTMTLKNGIENMLKHYVPEIIAVEAV